MNVSGDRAKNVGLIARISTESTTRELINEFLQFIKNIQLGFPERVNSFVRVSRKNFSMGKSF